MSVIRKGQLFSGWFADSVWGGRGRALVAARHFKDELLLRVEPDTRVRQQVPKGTRSATGIVGVSLERHVVDGRSYPRCVASWRDADRRAVRRRFSLGRYGKERAVALASKVRKAGLARTHREQLKRQREAAADRLRTAPARPRQVKDPRSRKGISMARRRPRGTLLPS